MPACWCPPADLAPAGQAEEDLSHTHLPERLRGDRQTKTSSKEGDTLCAHQYVCVRGCAGTKTQPRGISKAPVPRVGRGGGISGAARPRARGKRGRADRTGDARAHMRNEVRTSLRVHRRETAPSPQSPPSPETKRRVQALESAGGKASRGR